MSTSCQDRCGGRTDNGQKSVQKTSEPNLIDILGTLVSIDTADPPGGEIEAARYIAGVLEKAGLDYEIDEFEHRRANVLARVKGQGTKPPLVFSAHIDTVPVGRQPWTTTPFSATISNGRMYGRGSADMKSGLAAMLVSAIDLSRGTEALSGDLILAFTAGESSNCLGARRLVQKGSLADAGALLVSEPSSMGIIVAEMAVLWLRITARGRLGHVSGYSGVNAIDAMSDFIQSLRSAQLPHSNHPLLPAQTIRIGTISGGSAVNVTPDHCEAEVDVRLHPSVDPSEVIRILTAVAGPNIEIEVSDFKPAVETAPDHPFVVECMSALEAATSAPPAPEGVAYYSDATIYTAAHRTPFAIIGPGERGMSGQVDESVELAQVGRAVSVYSNIARRWLS